MRKPWTVLALFLFLSGACLLLCAERPDPHYDSPRTRSVVRQSTFLHGYLHGYEEGYSTADLDLQMARAPRDPGKLKQARDAVGYRSEFGSRGVFDVGYRQGFRVGYADSFAGRAFRAVSVIQQVMRQEVDPLAAAAQSDPVVPPRPWIPHASALLDQSPARSAEPPAEEETTTPTANVFDQGFEHGYSTGQKRGLADARNTLPFATPSVHCPAQLSQQSMSCTGFVRGFAMGYSDGYVNVARPPVTAAASAGSSK